MYLRKKENDIRVAIERNKQVVMKQEQKLLKKRGFMYFSLFNSLPKKKEHFYQTQIGSQSYDTSFVHGHVLKVLAELYQMVQRSRKGRLPTEETHEFK